MIIAPGFIGIDVSKDHLDIFDRTSRRIANTGPEIAAMVAGLETPRLVLFEATGRYDRHLMAALQAAGIGFARVNPIQARAFARATGRLAKTDRLDARMLAAMAQALSPAVREPADPQRQSLAELHRRRAQLVGCRQQERTRLHTAAGAAAVSIGDHIGWLNDHIAAIEAEIATLLRSIPGVGTVTANALIALLPELGRRSAKTIAALAGLAPVNRDSGTWRGRRTIAGGRPEVRRALYMAALTASRSSSPFAQRFNQLTARGKPAKLALIAVARKLLVTANAILATQTPYTP